MVRWCCEPLKRPRAQPRQSPRAQLSQNPRVQPRHFPFQKARRLLSKIHISIFLRCPWHILFSELPLKLLATNKGQGASENGMLLSNWNGGGEVKYPFHEFHSVLALKKDYDWSIITSIIVSKISRSFLNSKKNMF